MAADNAPRRSSVPSSATWLANAIRATGPPLIFGLRLWGSICLARYVAFWLQLDNPYCVAQRIVRNANLVGRDNVIAGSDRGFGAWVGQATVDPGVVWAELAAMAEGARLATKQFWGD